MCAVTPSSREWPPCVSGEFLSLHHGDEQATDPGFCVNSSYSISAAQTVPVYFPVRYLTLTQSFSRSFSHLVLSAGTWNVRPSSSIRTFTIHCSCCKARGSLLVPRASGFIT